MKTNKTIAKLKSLYRKFEIETEKYKRKEIEALEKQYLLPAVLKEYYLKIGEIDSSIEMEAYEMYAPRHIRMFTKENSKAINYKYNGDFLIFATEIGGVCEFAIKAEDLTLENPPLYTNLLEASPDNDSYWISASAYNTEEECFDTVLDFLYEIARPIGVDPEPRNNPKNVKLVIDVLLGNCPESDITPEVIKDVTKLSDLGGIQFKNFGAIRKLVNVFELSIFNCKGFDFEPISSLTRLSELNIRYCDITIDIQGIEQLSRLKELDFTKTTVQNISYVKHLSKLETLRLSSCGLNDISFLSEMHNLIRLDANDNQIVSLPVFHDKDKYQLAAMELKENKLTSLKNIQALKKLEELYVSKNPLTDISDLKGFSYFSQVDVSHCLLEDISVLRDMKEGFHTFNANNNRIKNLPRLTKKNELGTLKLQNNQIEDLSPLVGAGYILFLELEGNPLKDISAIKNIHKLKSVSLSKDFNVKNENYYVVSYYADNNVLKLEDSSEFRKDKLQRKINL